MEWPPSAPMREAMRPSRRAASMSAAVSAGARSAGYRSSNCRTQSICSSVAGTGSGASARTYTDQNCAPTPPARSRGMSVCRWADWSTATSRASRS
ncbi:hypothetical protein SALBM217S_06939 [Streptomyces griseoloalbus]